jgi:hypothetical protein
VLFVALLFPNVAKAQVYQLPTPPPQVTAANTAWQLRGDPVFYAGSFYYPAGPSVFFDGFVMVRSGTYEGVPMYVDSTESPYSRVYVPIGGAVMRPYERRREGELAGTVGSRTPSFPIQRDTELSRAAGATGLTTPPQTGVQPEVIPEAGRAVGTGGTVVPRATAAVPSVERPGHTVILGPAGLPRSNNGIWIPYAGARWYSAGAAVTYSEDRFVTVGEYHGFPVYRDKNGRRDVIYIPSVEGGPLAPFARR